MWVNWEGRYVQRMVVVMNVQSSCETGNSSEKEEEEEKRRKVITLTLLLIQKTNISTRRCHPCEWGWMSCYETNLIYHQSCVIVMWGKRFSCGNVFKYLYQIL